MRRTMCKSKIHRATVTEADLNYVGSITIDEELLEKADILPYEKVHVVNINNAARIETYVIKGKRKSRKICLNGAAARLFQPGDIIIIISYAEYKEEELAHFKPKVLLMGDSNYITQVIQVEIN